MANHVVVEDDIIYMTFEGDQTEATYLGISKETEQIVKDFVQRHKAVKVLVDVRRIGAVTLGVRRLAASNLREWPLYRVSIFGANTYLRHLANLVIMATGNRGAKVYKTEKEARAWLTH
jgi:hypothetical protein